MGADDPRPEGYDADLPAEVLPPPAEFVRVGLIWVSGIRRNGRKGRTMNRIGRAVCGAAAVVAGIAGAAADERPWPPPREPQAQAPIVDEPTPVRMAAEEVTLTLSDGGDLAVEAVFHMCNPSDRDVTIEVGFPAGTDAGTLREFAISRDGDVLDVSIVNRDDDFWCVWEATYPARQTVTDVVRYRTSVASGAQYAASMGPAEYILSTGAAWAGPIGRAVVRLRTAGAVRSEDLWLLRPLEGLAFEGDEAVWTFENVEPTQTHDIQIAFVEGMSLAERAREALGRGEFDAYLGEIHSAHEAGPLPGAPDAATYWDLVGRFLDPYLALHRGTGSITVRVGSPEDRNLLEPVTAAAPKDFPARVLAETLRRAVAAAATGDAGARRELPRLCTLLVCWQRGMGRFHPSPGNPMAPGTEIRTLSWYLPPDLLTQVSRDLGGSGMPDERPEER